jgi:hypothetical protein
MCVHCKLCPWLLLVAGPETTQPVPWRKCLPQVVAQEAVCACYPQTPAVARMLSVLRKGQQGSFPFTAVVFPDRCKTCSFMSTPSPTRERRLQGAHKPPTPQVAVYLHPIYVAPSPIL